MRALLLILAVCLSVTGCVTTMTYQVTGNVAPPDDESARAAIKKQDWPAAVLHLSADVRSTAAGTPERTRALFFEYPDLKGNVLRQVTEEARTQVQANVQLGFTQHHVAMVRGLNVYSDAEKQVLERVFTESLVAVIESESVAYDISYIRTNSEVFDREPMKGKLVEKALRRAANADEVFQRTQLLEFYKAQPVDSPYAKRIAEALPTLAFTPAELKSGTVAQVFPDFARTRLAAATVEVALTTSPSRRLLEDDLTRRLLSQSPVLSIVRSAGPQPKFEIVVRELELKEQRVPVNQQTKVVPPSEIDFMTAAFVLPAGASILYDVRHGGHRIEYGYEFVLRANGKNIEDKLARDKIASEYYQCSNLRYRTMGGQVRAFDIAPNANVVAWCRAGGNPVDESVVKGRMLDALASSILGMDALRAALNASRVGS